MSRREAIYGCLALLGLLGTWFFNVDYISAGGAIDPVAWIRLGFVNPAAASMTIDLLVAFAVFVFWTLAEARRLGMRGAWSYPALGLLVAFAFAFPLFLLMRERRLRSLASARPLTQGPAAEGDA